MALQNRIKTVLQEDIYNFIKYPYYDEQKFFASDTLIYYEDIEGERYATLELNSVDSVENTDFSTDFLINLRGHFVIVAKEGYENYNRYYIRPEDGKPILLGVIGKISTGVYGPLVVDDSSGDIVIPNFYVNLFDNAYYNGEIKRFYITGTTIITSSWEDPAVRYITVRYRSEIEGGPIIESLTTSDTINESDVIPIITVIKADTQLHMLYWNDIGHGLANRIHERLVRTERIKKESGFNVTSLTHSLTDGFTAQVAAGYVWYGATRIYWPLKDTWNEVNFYDHDGSGNWRLTTQTNVKLNSIHYDAGTGATTVANNEYAVIWLFIGIDDDKKIGYIVGDDGYNTLDEAIVSVMPSIPYQMSLYSLLVAKIISWNKAGELTSPEQIIDLSSVGTSNSVTGLHSLLLGRSDANQHPISSITGLQERFDLIGEPTGFDDCNNMGVVRSGNRIILTKTGGAPIFAYFNGEPVTGLYNVTSWTSSYYTDDGVFPKYLSSTNGSTPTWSNSPWTLDVLQIAVVEKTPNGTQYALRETHGFMPWQAHEEFHQRFGTYKLSGGTLTNLVYNSTTSRTPTVVQTKIEDEDLETVLLASSSTSYTWMWLTDSGTMNYSIDNTSMLSYTTAGGQFPYYNYFNSSVWSNVALTNNEYMSIWLLGFNAAGDITSQKFRYGWLMGQSKGSLTTQQNTVPADLNLGNLTTQLPEFVFLAKIIIKVTGNNWEIQQVYYLSGDKTTQIASAGGIPYHTHTEFDEISLNKIKNLQDPTTYIEFLEPTTENPAYKVKIVGTLDAELDCGGW